MLPVVLHHWPGPESSTFLLLLEIPAGWNSSCLVMIRQCGAKTRVWSHLSPNCCNNNNQGRKSSQCSSEVTEGAGGGLIAAVKVTASQCSSGWSTPTDLIPGWEGRKVVITPTLSHTRHQDIRTPGHQDTTDQDTLPALYISLLCFTLPVTALISHTGTDRPLMATREGEDSCCPVKSGTERQRCA